MPKRILLIQGNVLGFVGVAPVRDTLIGMVGDPQRQAVAKWVGALEAMGRSAG